MSDATGIATRRPALGGGARAGAAVLPLPPLSRFLLRGRDAAAEAAAAPLGFAVPREACRAAVAGDRAALWLGPDEWLVLAPVDEAEGLRGALTHALAELPHGLVDVSHRQIALEVVGAGAATLLEAGCPLPLHAAAFPVGMCTRTVLGKAEIVLWRTAPGRFHLEVWRSFADYAWRLLDQSRRDWLS